MYHRPFAIFRLATFVKALIVLLLIGCEPLNNPTVKSFREGEFPSNLSEWGVVFVRGNELVVNQEAVVYDLISPLFTDYAHKMRTIWVPPGTAGEYTVQDDISLPVGSVVSKTFYYPRRDEVLLQTEDMSKDFSANGLDLRQVSLIETRILVHLEDGWQGLPYIWNAAQQEAVLEITGASIELSISANTKRFLMTM